jgi:hypothetical protein
MSIPESIQKLLTEREAARAEITDKEKDLATLKKKEAGLCAKIEAAWQGQVQRIADLLK